MAQASLKIVFSSIIGFLLIIAPITESYAGDKKGDPLLEADQHFIQAYSDYSTQAFDHWTFLTLKAMQSGAQSDITDAVHYGSLVKKDQEKLRDDLDGVLLRYQKRMRLRKVTLQVGTGICVAINLAYVLYRMTAIPFQPLTTFDEVAMVGASPAGGVIYAPLYFLAHRILEKASGLPQTTALKLLLKRESASFLRDVKQLNWAEIDRLVNLLTPFLHEFSEKVALKSQLTKAIQKLRLEKTDSADPWPKLIQLKKTIARNLLPQLNAESSGYRIDENQWHWGPVHSEFLDDRLVELLRQGANIEPEIPLILDKVIFQSRLHRLESLLQKVDLDETLLPVVRAAIEGKDPVSNQFRNQLFEALVHEEHHYSLRLGEVVETRKSIDGISPAIQSRPLILTKTGKNGEFSVSVLLEISEENGWKDSLLNHAINLLGQLQSEQPDDLVLCGRNFSQNPEMEIDLHPLRERNAQ